MTAVSSKHAFTSSASQTTDARKVDAPKWNADHVYNGGSRGDVLIRDTTVATIGAAWQAKGLLDVRDYGAVGDGVTDDTAAVQAAFTAAAGGCVYFPVGIFLVTSEILYNVATSGSLSVRGNGPGSILKAAGASNIALHLTGTVGVTTNPVLIHGVQFTSATSGTSAALLHLDGLAHWWVRDCYFTGGTKAAYGIKCTASQQGEIGASKFAVAIGILCEPNAGNTVHANGIEIHGNTLMCSTKNIVLDRIDSGSVHSNHLTSADISIDVTQGGVGPAHIIGNHIESHVTAGVRADATVLIDGNQFFPGTSGVDVLITAAASNSAGCVVCNNLLPGSVNFSANVADAKFYGNILTNTGTITNNSTRLQAWGNSVVAHAATFATTGVVFDDKMTLTSRDGTAGQILTLNPNLAIGGSWGMKIAGAGASADVYIQLNDVILAGNTDAGVLRVKSGIGGTAWAEFKATGFGYPTGMGGTVTQGTSKSTGVTLSKVTGEITMHNAALAADTTVSFTLTNTTMAAGDYVAVQHVSAGTQAAYICTALAASGSATVNVHNATPGSLSEAIVLKFMVFKSATA